MNHPRAAGINVSLYRRFGGHGGISTEWEIDTDDGEAKELILRLPSLPLIGHTSTEHVEMANHARHWIHLPEGVTFQLAGEIVASLGSLAEDPLVAALHRASAEGGLHLAHLARCAKFVTWAAQKHRLAFTVEDASAALGLPSWRVVEVICALSGRIVPIDDGAAWQLSVEEMVREGMRAARAAANPEPTPPEADTPAQAALLREALEAWQDVAVAELAWRDRLPEAQRPPVDPDLDALWGAAEALAPLNKPRSP